MIKNIILAFPMSILPVLSGCGDPGEPTGISRATTSVQSTYSATLAEGIDFKRDGYPTFIATVVGLADEKEFFGRWSIADEVLIEFINALPETFTVELDVAAFGPNVNKPFKISIADKEQSFLIASGHPEKMQKIIMHFSGIGKANSMRFKVPAATSPKSLVGSSDERRLGVAFSHLKISTL